MNSIIFDLNGTLWDSTNSIVNAWNVVFKQYNLNVIITNESMKSILGKTNNEISEPYFNNLNGIDRRALMK